MAIICRKNLLKNPKRKRRALLQLPLVVQVVLEKHGGISNRVPLICCPFFHEQTFNCRYICAEWGFGMEMNSADVKRDEVEKLARELIQGASIANNLSRLQLIYSCACVGQICGMCLIIVNAMEIKL